MSQNLTFQADKRLSQMFAPTWGVVQEISPMYSSVYSQNKALKKGA